MDEKNGSSDPSQNSTFEEQISIITDEIKSCSLDHPICQKEEMLRCVQDLLCPNKSFTHKQGAIIALGKSFPSTTDILLQQSCPTKDIFSSTGIELEINKVISRIILEYSTSEQLTKEIADYQSEAFRILTCLSMNTKQTVAAETIAVAKENIKTSTFSSLWGQCVTFMGNVFLYEHSTLEDFLDRDFYTLVRDMFVTLDLTCKAQVLYLYVGMMNLWYDLSPEIRASTMFQAISVLNPNYPACLLYQALHVINEAIRINASDPSELQIFMKTGFFSKLLPFAGHENVLVRNMCIKTVFSICLGYDNLSLDVTRCGLLPQVLAALYNSNNSTLIHSLEVLNMIAQKDQSVIDFVLKTDILSQILCHLSCGEGNLYKDSLRAILSLIKISSKEQRIEHFTRNGKLVNIILSSLESELGNSGHESKNIYYSCSAICELLSPLNDDSSLKNECLPMYNPLKEILIALSEKYNVSGGMTMAKIKRALKTFGAD